MSLTSLTYIPGFFCENIFHPIYIEYTN